MKKNLLIPCNILKSLISKYKSGLNQLGEIFIDEIDEKASGNLEEWINSLNLDEKESLPKVLKLIGTPNLLMNVGIVIEGDSLIRSWAISNDAYQGFIGINENKMLEINMIENMTKLINSIMIYLDMAVPSAESNLAFKVGIDDMPTLFSLIDLHQRKKYSGMLDHTWLGEELFLEDIEYFFKESVLNPDERWLLPFSLDLFEVEEKSSELENSLQRLQTLKLLERKKEAWYFTPQGRTFADSCINRISQMSLSVIDADVEGKLQKTECILIRSNRTLWLFLKELGDNTMLITTLSGEKSGEFFNGLFSAEGIPREVGISQEPEISKTVNKNKVGKAPAFCSNCGSILNPNKKFCNICGKKIINN
ncbi:zinc ribbon domain-containing protein [Clostridium vincentii]|uniref:Zinc-ribbon domain-containing protein n=1 Tax=Clostridium vincentii TaxID=52704 RepID=A0A2T0BIM1_9CLOT|nr:zinc ribbon domain-containing protein [Clostridium vincentii]PRR83693.1 hypothetical protein CLVI_06400 [Clostridium vincentii]